MVFRKCPQKVSTPNSDLPQEMKNGAVERGVTKPNSRLTSFEFGLAITNFELEYQSHRSNIYETKAPAVKYYHDG